MGKNSKTGTRGGRFWMVLSATLFAAGCGGSSSSNPDANVDGHPSDAKGDVGDGKGGAGGVAGSDAGGMSGSAGGMSGSAGGMSGSAGGASGNDAGLDASDAHDAQSDGLDALKDLGAPDAPETTQPPGAPSSLTVSVADRRQTSFQLGWTAPATSWNAPVSSYQIRFARAPITSASFDDATMASPVTYTGTPAAVGQPDGFLVKDLNIETDYYFAVAALDVWGNRSAITAATTASHASFNVTILSGVGTDNSGFDLNGSGDLGTSGTLAFQPDGRSDLIVGATGGQHVYVYFGTSSGYSTTPSITITGAFAGFGRGVADAGDLDGDGLDDLAISSPNDNGGRVYIFSRKNPPASWGTTTSWPATLSDTQASYVISSTGTLSGVMSGHTLARVGDFDGAGGDDLAIGYASANAILGSVVIVKGGTSFASRTLPDATNAIEIDGVAAGGAFGNAMLGLGTFLPSAGTTLIVTAPIAGTSYAFGGHAPVGGVMTAAAADDSTVGTGTDRYGLPIAYLGPLAPSTGAFALSALPGKYVDVELGTAAAGPFSGAAGTAPAAPIRFVDTVSANSFGVVAIGSGINGTSQATSFIGSALPDLVLAGQGEVGQPIYIVNGSALTTLSGTIDISTPSMAIIPGTVKVTGKFPVDWGNGYTSGTLIKDLDGDGHADFAIGEFVSAKPGRVAVFY